MQNPEIFQHYMQLDYHNSSLCPGVNLI